MCRQSLYDVIMMSLIFDHERKMIDGCSITVCVCGWGGGGGYIVFRETFGHGIVFLLSISRSES